MTSRVVLRSIVVAAFLTMPAAGYAQEAVLAHGPLIGPWLTLRRLLRCHPWAVGGPDPVPPARKRLA